MNSYDNYITFFGNPYEEDVLTIDEVRLFWNVYDVLEHINLPDNEIIDVIGYLPDNFYEIEDKIFEEYEELIIENFNIWSRE